jgi:hopanoid biosynthesis associated protein HpnK
MIRPRLIVTADDFGLHQAVNEAVERGYRDGVLRAASLMVAAPAVADAVARAKQNPGLAVGLHLVLADGRAMLPPQRIPDLVDAHGMFNSDMVRNGFRFFFLPHVRKQFADEIRAQFEAFAATGLQLDHVNAHKHFHLHPTILSMMLSIGREYGMHAIRLPSEPGMGPWLRPWLALMRWRMKEAGIGTTTMCSASAIAGAWMKPHAGYPQAIAGRPFGGVSAPCLARPYHRKHGGLSPRRRTRCVAVAARTRNHRRTLRAVRWLLRSSGGRGMNMKRLTYLAGLLGLAGAIALVVHQGWGEVVAAIDRAGWPLLVAATVPRRAADARRVAWRILLAPRDPHGKRTLPFLFWVASIREASNRLLPVANIGGEIIGIRLVKWRGIGGAAAAASIIMEVLLTLVNQYLFTALGIILLIELTQCHRFQHGDFRARGKPPAADFPDRRAAPRQGVFAPGRVRGKNAGRPHQAHRADRRRASGS